MPAACRFTDALQATVRPGDYVVTPGGKGRVLCQAPRMDVGTSDLEVSLDGGLTCGPNLPPRPQNPLQRSPHPAASIPSWRALQ